MPEKRIVTCVICPVGCRIEAEVEGGICLSVRGHQCRRGDAYARAEAVDPLRTLTTTMRVRDGEYPVVSVKTDRPVPRRLLFSCMEKIQEAITDAPVAIGDILLPDILDTGSDLVATRSVRKTDPGHSGPGSGETHAGGAPGCGPGSAEFPQDSDSPNSGVDR